MSLQDTHPKISVVTVSYNQGEFIRKNIESVLAQNYPNFEHIVIDGGSTDSTLSILGEYPHLQWTSESDRGQSHALNKGFSRASGDIIAWLNSDDWYANDCFNTIVPHLKEYPLLLGAAQETTRDGTPTQIIQNISRTKYDLLRNWIPYAWLSQTSVFFTRELLESVRYEPEEYLDESLYFCMDLDLWLRFAHQYPFSQRVDQVLSYYRVYESNKTGARAVAGNKECMRTFRRYETLWTQSERKFSFLLPLDTVSDAATKTIASILEQDVQDLEIILIGTAHDTDTIKSIREYSFDLAEAINHINFRFEACPTNSILEAFTHGAQCAAAPLLCFSQVGEIFENKYCYKALQIFNRDLAAALIPAGQQKELAQSLFNPQTNNLDPLQLIQADYIPTSFIARKIAFEECTGFLHADVPSFSIKLLLLKLLLHGWWINLENELSIVNTTKPATHPKQQGLKTLIHAGIVSEIEKEFQTNEFLRFKAKQGFTWKFPEQIIEAAQQTLLRAPATWHSLCSQTTSDLQNLAKVYPECSVVWYFLHNALKQEGLIAEAHNAEMTYKKLASMYPESYL